MKIGCGQGDIAQRRHFLAQAVAFVMGDVHAPDIRRQYVAKRELFLQAQRLEGSAAEDYAGVAGSALVIFKQFPALFLLRRQRAVVATQIVVERRVRRNQRFFELSDGVGDRVAA